MIAPNSTPDDKTPQERLEEITNWYLDQLLEGKSPNPQEIIQAHPDLAQTLERRLLGLALAHRMAQGSTEGEDPVAQGPEPSSSPGVVGAAEGDQLNVRAFSHKIGRYQIRGVLGQGASAAVYRAYDPLLRRHVALKVVHSIHGTSRSARERFQRDARIAARLWHPHIVPIHESGAYRGRLYIDMELVQGETLEARLQRGPLDSREAAELVRKLAAALDYAHELGVVHRDVKPSNILLDTAHEPKLTDFGLARLIADETTITHEGQILGTPAYMSPEQAQGGAHQADRRSDVYGLGAVFYRALTGRAPFATTDLAATLYQVVHTQPPAPRQCEPAIPRDLETICLKAMAKVPVERFASAAALAEELRRWLYDEPLSIRRPTAWERLRRWARRNRLAARIAVAGVVLVALVGGILGCVAWSQYESAYKAQVLGEQEAKARTQVEARALEVEIRSALQRARQHLLVPREGRRRETQAILRQVLRLRQRLPAGAIADRLALETRSLIAASLGVPEVQIVDRMDLPWDGVAQWPVAMHPDGQSLAIGTTERPLVWTCGRAPPLTQGLQPPASRPRLRYGPDGKYLVFAPPTGGLEVWDENAVRCRATLEPRGIDALQATLAIGFGGPQALWACRADGWVSCWSPAGKLLSRRDLGLARGMTIAEAAFNGDATQLAFALTLPDGPRKVLLWDGKNQPRELVQAATAVNALAWSPDSRSVAVGTQDGQVHLWSAVDGMPKRRFVGPWDETNNLQFDAAGRWLLAGGRTSETSVWDIATGEQLLTSHYTLWDFARDGKRFAGTTLNSAAFVDILPPQNSQPLTGHYSGTQQLSWGRDNQHLVSVDKSFRVCVWNATRAASVDAFQVPPGPFYGSNTAAALSDDGGQVAFASGNCVRLREIGTGKSLGEWRLPRGFDRLAFADGRFLLVREAEVQEGNGAWQSVVYELRTGQPLPLPRILRPAQTGERSFLDHALSADGRFYCWSGPRKPPQARRIEVREVATGQLTRRLLQPCEEPNPEFTGRLSAEGRFLWTNNPAHWHSDQTTALQYDLTSNAPPLPLRGTFLISLHSPWAVADLHHELPRPEPVRTLQTWPAAQAYLELPNSDTAGSGIMSFSPNGRFLAWGSSSGILTLADLPALQQSVDDFERSVAAP